MTRNQRMVGWGEAMGAGDDERTAASRRHPVHELRTDARPYPGRAARAGGIRRRARAARWPLRPVGALAVAVTLAGLAACGGDGGGRARADVGAGPEGDGRGAAAVRPVRGGQPGVVLVSDERPVGARVAAPVSEPAKPSLPENVSYSDAEGVFRAGEYDRAAELFEAYTLRRPENPWGHYMLGISAWRAGDHGRAEAALKRTIEVDSMHVKGRINLARVLLEQRKASDALEHAERVVELKPESGEGWRVLGNARSDLGMVDDAVAAYREALVLDHRDAWTMNNLGLLMIREGRYEEALPPLARATELQPDVAVFQNNLGIALERSGHAGEAAEAFRAALVAKPDYEKARVSLERVEKRIPTATAEPLDLAALASEFADRVAGWKRPALGLEPELPLELLRPVEMPEQRASEPVVPTPVVEPVTGGDSTATSEPTASVGSNGAAGSGID